jgi:RNA polymerase sigma factor (sigma-70 family)
MVTRARSDKALIGRYAAGDEGAFEVLYARYRAPVLAVCMGVLGTTHDAEDALQETFASLAVVLRESPPRELRPWLTRVARNASIDVVRRRRRRALTLDGDVPDVPDRPAGAGAAELAEVLVTIRELPEGQRTALLMRELGGHSYAEIAALLETDRSAVRGLIARARLGLRSRRDVKTLHALVPVPAGGGLFAGGLVGVKGTLAAAGSVCAIGGLAMLPPPTGAPPPGPPRSAPPPPNSAPPPPPSSTVGGAWPMRSPPPAMRSPGATPTS